jgi:hypothetical protein
LHRIKPAVKEVYMRKTSCLVLGFIFVLSTLCLADSLVMQDGTRHDGTFVSATSQTISFRVGNTLHRYPRSQVQSLEFGSANTASSYAGDRDQYGDRSDSASRPSSRRGRIDLPVGTTISVLTNESIDSKNAREGQVFPADVAEDVTNSSGAVVIPKGSEAELVIRQLTAPGTTTGKSELGLDLQSLKVSGRRYRVSTEDVQQSGRAGLGKNKRTAEMVGGGALLGTLVGAIAGGGKGAAIGAAAGAGAGAGAQVLTRGKSIQVPAESKLQFRLDEPLRLDPAY